MTLTHQEHQLYSHAASTDPINVARSNQFTWTNNSVTEQQDLDLDFYNNVGFDP